MNREQRRATRFKRKQQGGTPGRWGKGLLSSLEVLNRVMPMEPEDAASCSTEARMAWHHITHGSAEQAHFDRLHTAITLTAVRASHIDPLATEVATLACSALSTMQARHLRTGKLGADADALRAIPVALDLYDQLLALCSPLQLQAALDEAYRRIALDGVHVALESPL